MEYSKNTKGYGKKPILYWIGLYIIIAIIVYGAIYLVYKKIKSSNGTGTVQTNSIY